MKQHLEQVVPEQWNGVSDPEKITERWREYFYVLLNPVTENDEI